MRTVVVGNRKLARQLLRHVLAEGWNVVGALVPEGDLATTQANFVPVDELVKGTDCSLHQTTDINADPTVEWLTDLDPDVCLCGGWSQIIDERVLEVPDRGFLGLHSSRLPEGRGGAPVNWSLIDGADEVWISLFYYVPAVDAGDIIARGSVTVEDRDDVKTVFDKLALKACSLVSSVRRDLEVDEVDAQPQAISEATYRPRRQPQDGLIDWVRDPGTQCDWIRAQTDPYPGAYTFHDGERLTVWRAEPVESASDADVDPGEIVRILDGSGVDVGTGGAILRLIRVQGDERPPRWADEYARGRGMTPGTRLGRHAAPDTWQYTGIRGPEHPTEFETNLRSGDTGALSIVSFSGSSHELSVRLEVDGEPVAADETTVDPEYRRRLEYEPTEPGTHTVRAIFSVDGKQVDTRQFKVFVHE